MIEYPSRVLLATDGVEPSAASVAVAMAGRAGAELHVVHVGHAAGTSGSGAAVGYPSALPGEPPGYAEREARKLLGRQVEEIRSSGGTVTEAHLGLGQPAAEVVAMAARRATLGKAADAIVRSAPCSVLVVRGVAQGDVPGEGPADAKEGGR